MPKAVFIALAVTVGASLARADELTPEKRDDIKQLIVSTGGTRLGIQFATVVTQGMAKTLKAMRPDIPERVFVVMNQEMIGLFEEKMNAPGGLVDRIVPVYAKHFTHQEIRDLVAFYQTDTGRKAMQVLPQIVAESMTLGQEWGRSLSPEINQRVEAVLRKEGIELPR